MYKEEFTFAIGCTNFKCHRGNRENYNKLENKLNYVKQNRKIRCSEYGNSLLYGLLSQTSIILRQYFSIFCVKFSYFH